MHERSVLEGARCGDRDEGECDPLGDVLLDRVQLPRISVGQLPHLLDRSHPSLLLGAEVDCRLCYWRRGHTSRWVREEGCKWQMGGSTNGG